VFHYFKADSISLKNISYLVQFSVGIHSSHKYSIKDGQGLPVTDCNKSICIAVES
jgi:hypothetical protein